jgi:glucose/arabinose dehydrogenase
MFSLVVVGVISALGTCPAPYPNAWVPPGFCARVWAAGVRTPRGMAVSATAGPRDVLVVARGDGVMALWDDDGDGVCGAAERALLVADATLTHGLALHGGFVFASSDTTVFRWRYPAAGDGASASAWRAPLGPATVVVANMNADGAGGAPRGHWTRTLAFDDNGRLYVSVGSMGNVDPDSFRARIRRFGAAGLVATPAPQPPADFLAGEVFADGLRNEVGLAFNTTAGAAGGGKQALFGVENGADKLARADLGGDIHNDNPAEELNAFPALDAAPAVVGRHYGYPYCFSQYARRLPPSSSAGRGWRGQQWAWPTFAARGTHTDAWCRQRQNNVPPLVSMPAHSAPLGITFFGAEHANASRACRCASNSSASGNSSAAACAGSFPCSMLGHAIVGFHGSWNREPPTGYRVVRVPFANGVPVSGSGGGGAEIIDLFRHGGSSAKWPTNVRPVDVRFLPDGRLLVSQDGGASSRQGEIIMISYHGTRGAAPPAASSVPAAVVHVVAANASLSGYGAGSFAGAVLAGFVAALANALKVSSERVAITSVANGNGNGTGTVAAAAAAARRRLAAALEVAVGFTVTLPTRSAAVGVHKGVLALRDAPATQAALAADMRAQIVAAGGGAPAAGWSALAVAVVAVAALPELPAGAAPPPYGGGSGSGSSNGRSKSASHLAIGIAVGCAALVASARAWHHSSRGGGKASASNARSAIAATPVSNSVVAAATAAQRQHE